MQSIFAVVKNGFILYLVYAEQFIFFGESIGLGER